MYVAIPAPAGTDPEHNIEIIQTGGLDTVQTLTSTHSHSVTLSGTTESAGGGTAHGHDLNRTVNQDTSSVGGGAAHSHPITVSTDNIPNMPPFEMAYCWRRTA